MDEIIWLWWVYYEKINDKMSVLTYNDDVCWQNGGHWWSGVCTWQHLRTLGGTRGRYGGYFFNGFPRFTIVIRLLVYFLDFLTFLIFLCLLRHAGEHTALISCDRSREWIKTNRSSIECSNSDPDCYVMGYIICTKQSPCIYASGTFLCIFPINLLVFIYLIFKGEGTFIWEWMLNRN